MTARADRAFRGTLVHCLGDPARQGTRAVEIVDDGLLLTADGRIVEAGPAGPLASRLPPATPVEDCRGRLLVPGFIDCHVHYPQVDIIGAGGHGLLDWLERYAYPAEARLADAGFAARLAEFFADQLLAHGTTTALVFASVHLDSAEAMFRAAEARDMRLITGKVAMDCGCPPALADTPDSAHDQSRALIDRWHGRGRLGYAITPRFALTSSGEQLAALGRLAAEYPDVHVHTHLAENRLEIEQVAARFPRDASYLDVYRRHGLLGPRSVFAHCVHVDDADRGAIAAAGAAIAHCPSSNLYLGSGLFELAAARHSGIRVGIGSDVGAGTSLSIPATLGDARKVASLCGDDLPAGLALYLATLGGAEALGLDRHVGNFAPGKEADLVVLDPLASPMLAQRTAGLDALATLQALMTQPDPRMIEATYVLGECRYRRET